jgi:hypothetical protein
MSIGMQPMARGLLRTLALSLHVALALVATRARGESQALDWDAPVGCPQRDEVLAAVKEITGPEVFARTSLQARGRIREVNGAYRLELEAQGETESQVRTIDAKVCRDLLGASAVVLGLNLKRLADAEQITNGDGSSGPGYDVEPPANSTVPSGSDSAPAAAAASNADATSNAAPKPVDPEVAATPDATDIDDSDAEGGPERAFGASRNNMWVAVPQVHLALGSVPETSLQWAAGVGWRSPEWLVWLSGRYQPAQSVQSKSNSGIQVSIARAAAEIGVAHGFRGDHLEWAPGVMIGVDYLMVEGRGVEVVASRAATQYPFVVVAASLRWFATDWLTLAATVGAEVPLARPRFTVDALGEVGQMGPANGRLSVGSEWNF